MRKKWIIIYAAALILFPVLLLFVIRLKSPAEIMTPPSLSGQNALIQQAFESSVKNKNDISLKYPSSGDYRSAFVTEDFDNDGEDEALVFYTLKSDEATVRINVLDFIDDKWVSVYDDIGYGSEVVSVTFDDFNNDRIREIVIGWSLYDANSSKVMTVHSVNLSGGKVRGLDTAVNQNYSYMGIADMDSDGEDEILVTWLDNSDTKIQKSYASLLKMSDKKTFTPVGNTVSLDGSVSTYASLKIQKINKDRAVAYLDAYKGDDSMITEVIWWDKNAHALVAPLLDPETLSNLNTLRTPAVPSMDIDNDGIIEIPVNKVSVGQTENTSTASGQTNAGETKLNLTTWCEMTPDGLRSKVYSFINNTLGYAFLLDDSVKDSVVVYRQTDKGVVTFYNTTDGTQKLEPLFTLSVMKKSEFSSDETYTFKVTNGENVIFGSITSAGQTAGFTNEKIEKSIVFFK